VLTVFKKSRLVKENPSIPLSLKYSFDKRSIWGGLIYEIGGFWVRGYSNTFLELVGSLFKRVEDEMNAWMESFELSGEALLSLYYACPDGPYYSLLDQMSSYVNKNIRNYLSPVNSYLPHGNLEEN
jgi:hypothetical protein